MATYHFKTNAKCGGCTAKIGAALEQNGVQTGKWAVDLTVPEKTLTVESDLSPEQIVEVVAQAGFKAEKEA